MKLPEITTEDLKKYCGFDYNYINDNKAQIDLMKLWASDIIWNLVKRNYTPSSEAHILAVTKAICSQIRYWIDTNTSPTNESALSGYSLGEMSGSFDTSTGVKPGTQLCSLARIQLNSEYLLYGGLKRGE